MGATRAADRRGSGRLVNLAPIQRQCRAHRNRLLDHLLEEAPLVREPDDLGHCLKRIIRLDIEVGPRLGASGLYIAPLDRSGEKEVELGAARSRLDRDLANVRVPRQLGEQSNPHRKRGIAERRRQFVVAADRGWLVGVDDMRAEGPCLERILAGQEFGDRGDRVIDRARLEIAVAQQAVDAWPLALWIVRCHAGHPFPWNLNL